MGTAQDNDPAPVTVLRPDSEAPFVLVCEHASNYIPPRYCGLGLPASELFRHIAWDIGAAELTRLLSDRLSATAFLSGASRLLIDCNRPIASPTSIPEVSEIPIPGNHGVNDGERRSRIQSWFEPFHTAIARRLDNRETGGRLSAVIGVHSFTPVLGGVVRSMHAGVLYGASARFGKAVLEDLRREQPLDVAENAPYRIDADDWTIPFHADRLSRAGVLLEVRNNELASPQDIEAWAERISRALKVGWRTIAACGP
jgi:predicted N-formylglutamate amidohydrolase